MPVLCVFKGYLHFQTRVATKKWSKSIYLSQVEKGAKYCKILTENVKYTSLMVFLFTRDTWHYSPFWSSSIPQCNLLLLLEVNSSIINVNILFNLTSSQTNIFVASAQVTLSVTHWKAADCDSCCTRMYWMAWWLCPKSPPSLLGTGDTKNRNFTNQRGRIFLLPNWKILRSTWQAPISEIQPAHHSEFTSGAQLGLLKCLC